MSQGNVMNEVKKAIVAEQVMQIVGEPTRQDVEELQREVAEIAVKYSTRLFQGGDDYGQMCLILCKLKYQTLIRDEKWTYQVPKKQECST